MLDASTIPTGEFDVGGTVVQVRRSLSGTVTLKEAGGRRIGYLTADGSHEGRRLVATLEAVVSGAPTVVRCDRCRAPLTDKTSRARGFGPECVAKLAAEGRAS